MKEEDVKVLLDSFGKRVPYQIYTDINRRFDISKKLSKYKIYGNRKTYIDKLKALSEIKEEDFSPIFEAINDAYRENIEYGSKYIQYFSLPESAFLTFLEFANNQELDIDNLSKFYPYMVDNEELKNNQINKIHLAKKMDNEDSLILIYTRVVDFYKREQIDPQNFISSIRDENFTEIYGVKRQLKQFVDIVYLNKKNNTVEIRIDYFKNTSDRQVQKQFSDFFAAFNAKLSNSVGRDFFSRKELNIHPIIKKINNDYTGRLVEICFSTKEGSNIRIKKRRAEMDIRKEAYHKAGSEAVLNNLDIFRIGIVWANENDFELEVLIPGSSGLVHTNFKKINEVIITNCKGISDFNFVYNKISSFLWN